ncbi:suppressor of kinetochore protein mutant [Tyrophagus putrescentiae]|nr:suppressor of kinetochore protein mutant [Tyrophagus putrescentiae]
MASTFTFTSTPASFSSAAPSAPALVIQTTDGQRFELSEEMARPIGLFRDLLTFTGDDADSTKKNGSGSESSTNNTARPSKAIDDTKKEEDKPIAVNVDSATMTLIMQWLAQHKADTEVIGGITDEAFRERSLPEWDQVFFQDLEYRSLAELIIAANYLDMTNLLFYTAKAIAGKMAGMSTEQMRAYAGIQWEGPIPDGEEGRRRRRRRRSTLTRPRFSSRK